ncbi:CU044_5270 family protein [Streptomyces sp. NPDC001890]|uniref:CU044_5270 family protein n=1 Tax=Streptomyces sp. NPDC001890 TaxID=3364620 RepID=UPI003696F161
MPPGPTGRPRVRRTTDEHRPEPPYRAPERRGDRTHGPHKPPARSLGPRSPARPRTAAEAGPAEPGRTAGPLEATPPPACPLPRTGRRCRTGGRHRRHGRHHGHAGQHPRQPPGHPPHATGLLDRIALAARGTDAPAVRADQFVYVRSWVAYAGQSAGGGPLTLPPVHTREVWLSADGSRPGLIRQEGEPDSKVPAPDPTDPSVSNPSHTYVDCLPTDPDALLNLIRTQTRGQGQDPDQRAFEAIGDLLSETWAPPRVSAALYRAAARIPGVTVAGTAKDAAGREGVTVARTSYGEQTQWIFDPATHVFLGRRTVLVEPNGGSPAGTVVATSAVLATAAADHAGDVP